MNNLYPSTSFIKKSKLSFEYNSFRRFHLRSSWIIYTIYSLKVPLLKSLIILLFSLSSIVWLILEK